MKAREHGRDRARRPVTAPGGNRGATPLRRRRREGCPMAAFDRLPRPLRRWLAEAALPWSPRSAARAWAAALRMTRGDEAAALARLDALQALRLARAGEAEAKRASVAKVML